MDLTRFNGNIIRKHYVEECKELIDNVKMLCGQAESDTTSISDLDDKFQSVYDTYTRLKDLHDERVRRLVRNYEMMDTSALLKLKRISEKNLLLAKEELKEAQERGLTTKDEKESCVNAYKDDIFGAKKVLEKRETQ